MTQSEFRSIPSTAIGKGEVQIRLMNGNWITCEIEPEIGRTVEDLMTWIKCQQEQGNSVPMFIRGGGLGWITPDDDVEDIIDESYKNVVFPINETSEDYEWLKERFTTLVGKDDIRYMSFVCVPHQNGRNQENFDMFFGVWDD